MDERNNREHPDREQQDMPPQGDTGEYRWNFEEYENSLPPDPSGKKNRGLQVFITLVAGVLAVLLLGFAAYGVYEAFTGGGLLGSGDSSDSSSSESSLTTEEKVTISDTPGVEGEQSTGSAQSYSAIYKKVSPSVVGIVAYTSDENLTVSSQGSGIIIQSDGYIVTNEHVVSGATGMIKVVFNDGNEMKAQIVGTDTRTDLAVLKVGATGLRAAEFGDSSQLEVGDVVLAIGNPGGLTLAGSLTEGIVSGVDRPVGNGTTLTIKCIQTSAAINPGNSGGALVNMAGQVVGINSSKIANVEYEGIGFAIPSKYAEPIINDILEYGYVKNRVSLGVTVRQISSLTASRYGLVAGIQITDIDETGSFYKAGAMVGDVITEIGGQSVTTLTEFFDRLEELKPGQQVTFRVYRKNVVGAGVTVDINTILETS